MTKYVKEKEMNEKTIKDIAMALQNGRLVIFPTDTVYGLGTNAYDEKACERIYEVKERPKHKPLTLLISDIAMLENIVSIISPLEQKLIDTFWPDSLTIKFHKKKDTLPDIISAGDDFVRVRLIGKENILYEMIEYIKIPIVAPSANLSGNLTGTKIENIRNEFDGKVDYILDYGDIESDVTSTLVEVKNDQIVILREGKVKKEDLLKVTSSVC